MLTKKKLLLLTYLFVIQVLVGFGGSILISGAFFSMPQDVGALMLQLVYFSSVLILFGFLLSLFHLLVGFQYQYLVWTLGSAALTSVVVTFLFTDLGNLFSSLISSVLIAALLLAYASYFRFIAPKHAASMNYFTYTWFHLLIFFVVSFLLLAVGFFAGAFTTEEGASYIGTEVVGTNLYVIDLLNNRSDTILQPHVASAYQRGAQSTLKEACQEDPGLNVCSTINVTSRTTTFTSYYLSQREGLFEKAEYVTQLRERVEASSYGGLFEYGHLLLVLFQLLVTSLVLAAILYLFRLVNYLVIWFLSWVMDPLGIESVLTR